MLRKLDLLHPETVAPDGVSPEEKQPRDHDDLDGYVSIAKPLERKDDPAVPEAPEAEETNGADQPE